jgi:C-terminal processing protease CtpA/Prc
LEPPVGTASAAEFGPIIDKLGSPSYAERETATERMIEIGPPAFLALQVAYRETEELEVKLRIERIVREAFLNHYVFDKNGFLGISQARTPVEHEHDDRIQEGHVGVKVVRVIPDTAAERAELKQDDIIIALDGVPIPHSGAQVVAAFGESIRVRGPRAKVTLTLLRGTEQIEFDVTLGSRPRRYYDRNQGQVYEMLDNTRERFRAFWDEHFRQRPTLESGDGQP